MKLAQLGLMFMTKEMMMTLRSVLVKPRVFKLPFSQCRKNQNDDLYLKFGLDHVCRVFVMAEVIVLKIVYTSTQLPVCSIFHAVSSFS